MTAAADHTREFADQLLGDIEEAIKPYPETLTPWELGAVTNIRRAVRLGRDITEKQLACLVRIHLKC